MQLVESFLSIQGEGKFAGKLAIFIRFAGCNLKCKGFGVKKSLPNGKILLGCDTIKAAQSKNFSYKNVSFDELKSIINNFNAPTAIIVITGGEPLLQHKNADFKKFITWLVDLNKIVQFESNGTILPDFLNNPSFKHCYYALSIKLANSGEKKQKRIKPDAIKGIFTNAKAFYKFVLKGKKDEIYEIKEILSLQNGEVFCMPLAKNKKELKKRAKKVANLAIKEGFNYSDRLHIRLWDNKEGV